jgi:hypothetical protein
VCSLLFAPFDLSFSSALSCVLRWTSSWLAFVLVCVSFSRCRRWPLFPISLPPVHPGLNLLLESCSSKCFATRRSLFGFGIGPAPTKHRPSVPCCHFPISRTSLSFRGLLRVHRASSNLASAPGARSHCAQPLYFYSVDTERGCETVGGEIPSCARCCCPVFILAAGSPWVRIPF